MDILILPEQSSLNIKESSIDVFRYEGAVEGVTLRQDITPSLTKVIASMRSHDESQYIYICLVKDVWLGFLPSSAEIIALLAERAQSWG